ncbi:hypothetical protein, partial [Limnofasciculus baicalensis]
MERSKVRKGDGVLTKNHRWINMRGLFSFLMTLVLVCGLVGCGDSLQNRFGSPTETSQTVESETIPVSKPATLSEVAPPSVIQQLGQRLADYAPQVTILSPTPDQVLQDTTVSVQLQVQDLPTFKDPELGMGPHLHVILDDQPYIAVYDTAQPLVLENLSAGTHTLRVFPVRPWHESFKNEGAYSQTTFHVFTKTPDNNPDSTLPLLTYSRPTGTYGGEPIMLDFYLTNAPLHLVATENSDDDIADWRIRVTVNGESFVVDRWLPVYLKGFKEGKNWVQLEFIDDLGNSVNNVFNNTARVFTYEQNGNDTLSLLVRGEISADAAGKIVDPNYEPIQSPASSEETPNPTPSPTTEAKPTAELETPPATPEVESVTPETLETPEIESVTPETLETPEVESVTPQETPVGEVETPSESATLPSEVAKPEETPTNEAETPPVSETSVTESVSSEDKQTEQPENNGMFGRLYEKIFTVFQGSEVAPNQSTEVSEEVEVPSSKPSVVPEIPQSRSQIVPIQEVTPEQPSTTPESV